MQIFTYSKHGAALRQFITMLLCMLMADVVTIAVVTMLVHGWWQWAVGGGGTVMLAVAVCMLTRPLRTRHHLDGQELRLQMGRFGVTVPRDVIAGAELWQERLPRGVAVPSRPAGYDPDSDTLFVLADRRGLVAVTLNRPVTARVRQIGDVAFSRLVLSLDEPERFVAAVAGAGPVAVPAVDAAPVAAAAPRCLVEGAPAIRLDGLVKRYDDFMAVAGVSLEVRPGEVLAFLGANGAGKTTTIRMLTGLLRPTAGRVEIEGQDLWTGGPDVRRRVGYVPDIPLLYEGLTAREFLWLVAGLYGLSRAEGRQRAEELLAQLKLERWGDHLIRHFSLGMKRKLAIAAALLHRPRVLLLDEVTNGLDPRAAREVKDLIAAAAADGAAVFLTTHLLDVVQELADRVAIIDRGRLRAVGTMADLRRQAGRPVAGLEELFLALTGGEVVA